MKHLQRMIAVLALTVASVALAAIPQKLSYQGVLTNPAGQVVPDGSYSLSLSLYDTLSGGSALWTETQSTVVSHGIFNVILGAVTPIAIAFDKPLYLGVAVAGGAELSPRTMLTSSPYSLNTPVMTFVSSGNTTTLGTDWTNYEDDSVSMYCPGPGYVIVRSTAWLQINHTQGTADRALVANDTIVAGSNPNYDFVAAYLIGADEPTMYQDVTLPVQTVFAIPAAGSHTFYLNGMMGSGQDANDHFWYANTTVEWYPASNPVPTVAHTSAHGRNVEKTR
jgi:hypothetical protein